MKQLTAQSIDNLKCFEKHNEDYHIPKIQIFALSVFVYLAFFVQNTTLILLTLGVASIFIVIRPISLGLPLYWIFCFSTQYYAFSGLSAARVMGIALFFGLMLRAVSNKVYKINIRGISIIIMILVYAGISVLFSLVPNNALIDYFVLVINVVILIAFYFNRVNYNKINESIYFATICSLLFIVILILFKSNFLEGMANGSLSRVSVDKSQNAGEFGRNMVVYFGILLFSLSNNNKNKKIYINIIALVFTALCIVISGSRASVIGACVVAFLYKVMDEKEGTKKNKLRHNIVLLIAIICFCVILFYLSSYLYAVFNRYSITSIIQSGGSRRFYIWELYIKHVISNNFIFGVGVGGTSEMAALLETGQAAAIYLKPAHNMYIQLMVEFGLIGFTLFMFFYLQLFRTFCTLSKEDKKLKKRYLAIFITLLIMAMGEPMFYCKPFWIIVMFIVNMKRKNNIKGVGEL